MDDLPKAKPKREITFSDSTLALGILLFFFALIAQAFGNSGASLNSSVNAVFVIMIGTVYDLGMEIHKRLSKREVKA